MNKTQNDLLEQVYHAYSREIYLYLYTLGKNHELAEDLKQETFLKAILSLPVGHTNIRAWLYAVARNLYFNHATREKKIAVSLDDEMTDEPVDSSQPPEESVLGKLQNRALYDALLTLNETKREIILLQYFSGLSGREIAALLGLREENVRVLSYRTKKELKNYMEEQGYGLS